MNVQSVHLAGQRGSLEVLGGLSAFLRYERPSLSPPRGDRRADRAERR